MKYRKKYRRKNYNYSYYFIILIYFFIRKNKFLSLINNGEIIDYKEELKYIIPIIIFILALSNINNIKKVIERKKQKNLYLNSNIRNIDKMGGLEFEKYLAIHFKNNGYKVKETPATNDYGADLIVKKDGIKTVVQAKRYNSKVSNKAIQEIVSAKSYYKADRCMVVTNSYYTKNAKVLANVNNVELWDRNILIKKFQIHAVKGEKNEY